MFRKRRAGSRDIPGSCIPGGRKRGDMRIAHISDLHLSSFHSRSNIRRTKDLLDRIDREGVDHVVITGDIAGDARREDFLVARKLLQSHGLLDSRLLSVIPGNHDIYGGVYTVEELLNFPRRCRRTDLRRKGEEFREAFHEAFEGTQRESADFLFPFVKPVGDVLFIGLDSVPPYSTVMNPVGSNGAVDEDQQDRLDRMMSSGAWRGSRRIVLIHHHFDKMDHRTDGTMQSIWKAFEQRTMKLYGKRALMKLFRKHGVETVLHGHYHRNTEYLRKGLHFVNGGGSILTPQSPGLYLNVLEVDGGGIRVQRLELPPVSDGQPLRVREVVSPSPLAAA